MKLLILNARIRDPQSSWNGKQCDLLINDSVIEDIRLSGKNAFTSAKSTKKLDARGANVSPGWFDMRTSLRDPGFEYKEDINSAAQAAAAGGFTGIACLPETYPPIHSKGEVEYVINKSKPLPVSVYPYGSVSKNLAGADLAELYDMHQAGAVAFTDGNRPVAHAGLMTRALLYAKIFDGLIISHAEDLTLSASGRMHEGSLSTSLGLKGIPNIAEELMVVRDIELARYAGTRVHFSHVSGKGTVDLVRKAKKQKLPVTCDVAVTNLCFTDEDLKEYDSNFKLNPPLRSAADQKALWDGLIDGTIDCIVSDHQPENKETKEVEFEYATTGMINLQTAYSLLNQCRPKTFTEDMLVSAMSINPRRILNLPAITIAAGSAAELSIYDPVSKWTYTEENNRSRSSNSPLLNATLNGKVIAVYCKGSLQEVK